MPDAEDAESAPTLSLVIPNACHDGADQPCAEGAPAGPAAADAWLKEQLDPLLASKAYKDDGLVLLTFDTAPDASKPVGALLISELWTRAPPMTATTAPPTCCARSKTASRSTRSAAPRTSTPFDHKPFTVRQRPRNE